MSNNQLNDLSKTYLEAVYGGAKKEEPKDTRLVVTAADKKANTKAYQNYKAGNKAYKAADHLKDDYEFARHKASIISRGGRLEDAVESWNQKLAYREAMQKVNEKKEVDVKDTYKTVAAIVDYDRAKKGSKDATYDSMKGDKKAAKKERDYAAFERGKMKKDDPNWKSKKYHTGMHGESYETTKTKEVMGALKKRDLKQDVKKKIAADIVKKKGDTSKSDDRYAYEGYQSEGYGKKKKKHDCASKVKHEEYGIGKCIPEMHDLDEDGNVAHYDVQFGNYTLRNVPVEDLEILEGHMHEHVIHTEEKKVKNCGCGQNPCVTYGKQDQKESYETTKTKEVMGALKKRDLKKDVKKKIAADIVKRKGDTSKSDDRYAYENYQAMRNPEKEEKKDTRTAKQKRMDSPDKGINSPAFKEFMRSRGM